MFCTKCGNQIPDDAKICTSCGCQIDDECKIVIAKQGAVLLKEKNKKSEKSHKLKNFLKVLIRVIRVCLVISLIGASFLVGSLTHRCSDCGRIYLGEEIVAYNEAAAMGGCVCYSCASEYGWDWSFVVDHIFNLDLSDLYTILWIY